MHGGAKGADQLAHKAAEEFGLATEVHLPDWERHGRGAGFARNLKMIALGADVGLAFLMRCILEPCQGEEPHGTHGAGHCVKKAREAGIEVRVTNG